MRESVIALFATLLIILLSTPVHAESEQPQGEPDIVIKQMEDKVIHEYRINGFLYAIKVIPNKGKPYYLVAEEGGDNFVRLDEPGFHIPKWEILTW